MSKDFGGEQLQNFVFVIFKSRQSRNESSRTVAYGGDGLKRLLLPRKLTWHPKSWRFGSDDFPFQSWVILRFQPLVFGGVLG